MASLVQLIPSDKAAPGGLSVARSISVVNTGMTPPKAAPGKVYGWHASNANAARVYLKLYDKATAAASTDTPLLTLTLPAGGVISEAHPHGINFAAGIAWRACTGVADNDNTAPAANDVVANLFYA